MSETVTRNVGIWTAKTATVATFQGKEIEPLKFNYTFYALESVSDIPPDEVLTEKDILTFVNARRNASARAMEQNKTLREAGHEVASVSVANDPEARLRAFIKLLILNGETPEDASQMAATLLKVQ